MEDAKRELEAASGPLRSEGKIVEAAVNAVIARAEGATLVSSAATAAADWAARQALQRLVLLAMRREVQVAAPAQNLILRPALRISLRLLPLDSTEILTTLTRILSPVASNLFYLKCGRDEATHEQLGLNTPEARQVLYVRTTLSGVYSAYWLSNVLLFVNEGGLEAIKARIRVATLERNDPARRPLPLEALKTYLEIVARMLIVLQPEIAKSMGEMLRDFTFTYMSLLSDDELKGEERKTTHEITTLLEELMNNLNATPSEIAAALDRHTLGVALKCFRSPYLLKRLQGLQELKEAITIASRRDVEHPVMRPLPPVPGQPASAPLAPDQVVGRSAWLHRWMRENGVLEELFGKNAHPAVVRACSDVVRFIAGDTRHLEAAQLELVWSASAQHELRGPVFDVIAELAGFLCAEDIGVLYEKMRTIPLASYDPQVISLLRNFGSQAVVTIYGVQHHQQQRGEHQPATPPNFHDKPHYGLAELWAAVQDENNLPLDIVYQALTALNQVLEWLHVSLPYAVGLRLVYAVQATENLRNSRSIPPSLRLIRWLATNWRTRRLMQGDATAADLIDWLEKHYQLAGSFLDDMTRYKKRLHDACIALGPNVPQDLNNSVLVGRHSFWEHVTERVEFLDFMCERGTATLGRADMQRVWTMMVEQATTLEERDHVLHRLEAAQTRGLHGLSVGWSDEVAVFLFDECLARLDFSALTPFAMSAFEFFLRYVNWRQGIIDRAPEQPLGDPRASQPCHVTDLALLRGGDLVWRAVLEAHDPAVGTTAIALLHSLQRGDQARRTDMYLSRCFKYIQEANAALLRASDLVAQPGQLQRIDRCLTLLRLLLDDHVSANPGSTASAAGVAREEEAAATVRLAVSVMPGGKFELEMRGSDTAAALAAELSKRSNIPLPALRMITQGKELKPTLETLYSLKLHQVSPQSLFVTRKHAADPTPMDTAAIVEAATSGIPAAPAAPAPATPPSAVTVLSTTYFDDLFRLLSLETLPGAASVVERAWSMVMLAPMNPRMVARVAALGAAGTPAPPEAWDEVLDGRTSFRLLYSLNVLSALLRTEDSATVAGVSIQRDWPACFAQRGGPERLGRIFLSLDFSPASLTTKRLQCLSLLLAILRRFLLAPSALPTALPSLLLPPVVKPLDLLVRSVELSAAAARAHALSDLASLPADLKVIAHSIQLISAAAAADRTAAQHLLVAQQTGTVRWLECLLTSTWETARAEAQEGVSNLARHMQIAHPTDELHMAVLQCLFLVLPSLDGERTRGLCLNYFDLVADLLTAFVPNRAILSSLAQASVAQFMDAILQRLEAHPVLEAEGTAEDRPDNILIGLFRVVTVLANRFAAFKRSAGARLVDVTYNALFAIPTAENHGTLAPPKCKSKYARVGAFKLLSELATDDWANFALLSQKLIPLHDKNDRRTWNFSPSFLEKAACGYVGLKNQGATCYMNSLMQQLYMVPAFRYGVLQLRPLPPAPAPSTALDVAAAPATPAPPPITPEQIATTLTSQDSIVFQLQNIFANLQESSQRYYDARPFCNAYREPNGAPMNVEVQMDADEFFSMLVDRLERQLRATSGEALLKELFGGTISHQILSRECAHGSEREETFYTLGVEVKNKKTLAEGLDLFVQGDALEGDNKWMCEECGRKVAALKRAAIKSLPNTLIVGLKRFEFDFETMRRIKVNDLFEFPHKFSAQPWTREGLQRRENKDKDPKTMLPLLEDDAYEYELVGVLVHSGTAESGHYYSFIKERSSSGWFFFNDTGVEAFDERQLPSHTYGGQETNQTWDSTLGRYVVRPGLRSYSAYMLFYQRKYRTVAPNASDWLPPLNVLPLAEASKLVPPPVYNDIWSRNAQYHSDRALYSPEYFSFLVDLLKTGITGTEKPGAVPNGSDIATNCVELGLRFACETLFHSRDRDKVMKGLLELLRPALLTNARASAAFLDALTSRGSHWLKGYTLDCDVEETRIAFFDLVTAALSAVRPASAEPMAVDGEKGPQALILRLLDALWQFMPSIPAYWRTFEQYFRLIEEIARLGAAERHWLLAHNAVTDLCEFLFGEEAPRVKAGTTKKPIKMGDKWSSPNLVHAVNIISILVRSVVSVAAATSSPGLLRPPYPTGLSVAESDLVRSPQFLITALKEGSLAVPEMQELTAHLCWENSHFSEGIIMALCHGLHTQDASRFRPFFYVVSRLLSLDDSLSATRIPLFLNEFLRVIESNLKYRVATAESLRFIARLLRDPKASVAQATQARMLQTTTDWLESWLLRHVAAIVREAAALIVEALLPSMPTFDALVISRAQPAFLPDDPTEEGALRQLQVGSLLLALIPAAKNAAAQAAAPGKPEEDAMQCYHLMPWARLIRTHMRTPAGREVVHSAAAGFADLWQSMEALKLPTDLNKREVLRTLHFFFTGSAENAAALVRCPELVNALIEHHVLLKAGSEAPLYFHQISLHYLWDLLRTAALADENLHAQLLAHKMFGFAWRQLVLVSQEYTRVAQFVEAIINPALSRQEVRHRAVLWCLDPELGRLHPNLTNYSIFLRILPQLLVSPEEQTLYFEEGRGLQQLARLWEVLAELPRAPAPAVAVAVELFRLALVSLERRPDLCDVWDNRSDMAKAYATLMAGGSIDHTAENLRVLGSFIPLLSDTTTTEVLWGLLFTSAASLPQGPPLEAAQAALLAVCAERPSPKKSGRGITGRQQLAQALACLQSFSTPQSIQQALNVLEQLLRLSPQVAVIVRDSPALPAVVAKTFTIPNSLTIETVEAIFALVQPKPEVLPDEIVEAILSAIAGQLKAALQTLPTSQQDVERLLKFLSILISDARFAASFREKYAVGIVLPNDPQLDVPESLRGLIGAPK